MFKRLLLLSLLVSGPSILASEENNQLNGLSELKQNILSRATEVDNRNLIHLFGLISTHTEPIAKIDQNLTELLLNIRLNPEHENYQNIDFFINSVEETFNMLKIEHQMSKTLHQIFDDVD